MKYIHNKAFPHPVLSSEGEDYIGSAFQPTLMWKAPEKPGGATKLLTTFILSEKNLIGLIDKEQAEFAIEIHCPKTYTRRMVKTYGVKNKINPNTCSYTDEFPFGKGDLHGQVTTNCYIISKRDIKGYSSENFHSDYEKSEFHIEEGSVLAIYPPFDHYFDTEPERPIGTFFRFLLDNRIPDGQFYIDYENDDYIGIALSGKTKSQIEHMRKQSERKSQLWSGLYFPAILEILHEMQENSEDHRDKAWFVGVGKALASSSLLDPKIDFGGQKSHDLLKAVQQILSNPLNHIIYQGE